MFYTLIFALGLSSILIPVALGFRFFIYFFDSFHKEIYYFGGLFLILMGIMTLKPIFNFEQIVGKGRNPTSEVGWRLGTGLYFRLCFRANVGVEFLLLRAGSFCGGDVDEFVANDFSSIDCFRRLCFGNRFPPFYYVSFLREADHWIGSAIFITSGVLIIILTFQNKIQMYQMEGYSRPLRLLIYGS